jgi:SAM-dependent methyltransferase
LVAIFAGLFQGVTMHQYQDTWVKGKVTQRGERDCAPRYEVIRKVAAKFRRPFTVLDIGANLGYYSLRLAEDFDCTVLAVEGQVGPWLSTVLNQNQHPRVIAANRNMTLEDLRTLADVEHFDLVLGLSVTHHFDAPYAEVLAQIRRLGFATILELPTEDNACGQQSVKDTFIPDDGEVLAWHKSHLDGPERPMVLLHDENRKLSRSYWGSPIDDCAVTIEADYKSKTKTMRGETSPWMRGINLETWLQLGPLFPSRDWVVKLLADAKPSKPHGDLKTHNIIFQGDRVAVIDWADPRWAMQPDDALWRKLLERVRG